MKLRNLFENAGYEAPDEWMNYIYSDFLLLTSTMIRSEFKEYLKSTDGGKFKGLEFFGNMDNSRKKQFIRHWGNSLNEITFKPDGIEFRDFSTSSADVLGPPPFKILSANLCEIMDITIDKIEDWFPQNAKKIVFRNCEIKSFSGIEKIVKKCERIVFDDSRVDSNLLPIYLVGGLKEVIFREWGINNLTVLQNATLQKASDRYFANKDAQDLDIFDMQETLVDLGLKNLAQI